MPRVGGSTDGQGLYASAYVRDRLTTADFYATMLGLLPDDRPPKTLIQERGFGTAGIQLFLDPQRAGNSRMTIVVPDLASTQSLLSAGGIEVADLQHGAFGKVGQARDPDAI